MGGRGGKMCPDCVRCCTKDTDKDVQHFQENQTSHAEKLAITAKQGETFKADSDYSENKTRKKHMQDYTDSEDEDQGRGSQIQVIDYVGVMQIGPIGKAITNNYIVPKPKKKEPPQVPKNKSDTGDGSKDGGEDFRLADGGKLTGQVVDMLSAIKKSVGIIRGPGNLQGTGFLLNNNLVMTAYHVIKDIVSGDENEKYLNLHSQDKLFIQFGYQQAADTSKTEACFIFTPDIQFYNPELDVAVLKLSQDSTNLPKPFEHFSPVQQGMKAHMIGHPQGGILEIDPNIERFELSDEMYHKAEAWSLKNHKENGYIGIQNERRILFHCRFAHGASGSPGCYTDPTKKNAEVVWMLLEGYPGFHYKNQTRSRQTHVPDEFLIEQGVTMEAIWQDMFEKKPSLCRTIFGSRNELFIPNLGSTCIES